ncbi:uncharacterized protein BDR25DRAFT_355227 [Lindgomyces ingoldianus]|uniref:Uncharacterized protein n=1 Tax=Lindgomyces ingoldianus TaxID=673940 RepID=A0ACB6QX36_9PLEO|nr:uncharacterized protein BDR25DRAFT_355227 [Lindgomyces ingoldianus]KAF2470766.1 hypothetical protein BDR25DRAFT_355227 [Lindgomyces ingoldianus]
MWRRRYCPWRVGNRHGWILEVNERTVPSTSKNLAKPLNQPYKCRRRYTIDIYQHLGKRRFGRLGKTTLRTYKLSALQHVLLLFLVVLTLLRRLTSPNWAPCCGVFIAPLERLVDNISTESVRMRTTAIFVGNDCWELRQFSLPKHPASICISTIRPSLSLSCPLLFPLKSSYLYHICLHTSPLAAHYDTPPVGAIKSTFPWTHIRLSWHQARGGMTVSIENILKSIQFTVALDLNMIIIVRRMLGAPGVLLIMSSLLSGMPDVRRPEGRRIRAHIRFPRLTHGLT